MTRGDKKEGSENEEEADRRNLSRDRDNRRRRRGARGGGGTMELDMWIDSVFYGLNNF